MAKCKMILILSFTILQLNAAIMNLVFHIGVSEIRDVIDNPYRKTMYLLTRLKCKLFLTSINVSYIRYIDIAMSTLQYLSRLIMIIKLTHIWIVVILSSSWVRIEEKSGRTLFSHFTSSS